MSRKMNPYMAFSPSFSQRLWDFLSLANIWLSWKLLFFPWSVSSLSWAGATQKCPDLTEPLQGPAPIFWPWSFPVSSSRYHKAWWTCSELTGKHHILSTVPSTPRMDFHWVSLLLFPILTPKSFSLVYTWSELQCWLRSFSCVSVRLSSHCVWLSQSSTSWTAPSGVNI